MARSTGARTQVLAQFETVYGTPPSGDYRRLPFKSTTLGTEQPVNQDDLLGHGRNPAMPFRDAVTTDGQIVVPVEVRDFGLWLKALLGDPDTTGTEAPYTHSFTGAKDTLPSLTVEVGHVAVPRTFLISGLVVNSLALTWQPTGVSDATLQLIGQGETAAANSGGGTPASHPLRRFHQFHGSIEQGGNPLGAITAASLELTNNLDPVRTIRPDGKIDGVDLGLFGASGALTARFADTALLDAATGDTPIDLRMAYTIDANNSLAMVLPEVHLARPRLPVTGPGGVSAEFQFQIAKPTAAEALTVILVNDVASY